MKSESAIVLQRFKIKARTIRDIVEHDPWQVSEVWCRKIYRQLLQLLERQYAMQLPHRPITKDTVLIDPDGKPYVLATISDTSPELTKDLTALARLIHYAITHETVPTGPLRGRSLEGYSNSLISAVDRCTVPRFSDRPRTVEDVRDILGIVALRRAMPPRTGPPSTRITSLESQVMQSLPLARTASQALPSWQRLATVAGSVAVMLSLGLATLPHLRGFVASTDDASARQQMSHTLQPRRDVGTTTTPRLQPPLPTDAGSAMAAPTWTQPVQGKARANAGTKQAAGHEVQVRAIHTETNGGNVKAPAAPAKVATAPRVSWQSPMSPLLDVPAQPAIASAPGTSAGSVFLHVQIQPWGVVYVDGVERGVSPPLKRLAVAPGRHTIRVTNPNSTERVLDIDTAESDSHIGVDFNSKRQ